MKRLLGRWSRVGTGSGVWAGFARLLTYALLLFLALNCIMVDFQWPEQAVLGILTIALGFAIHGISDSELVTLALMFASMLATARYAYWRCSSVFDAAVNPGQQVAEGRSGLHVGPAIGGSVCVRHPISGLRSNHPPFAPASCSVTRGVGAVAPCGRSHSNLQRASHGCAEYGICG